MQVWNLEYRKMAGTLTGHRTACTAVEFHPYGEFFASGSADTNLKIWDLRRKSCIQTYKGHTGSISSIRFSPHGRWVATGGQDSQVKVWDLTAGKLMQNLDLHKGPITSVAFHPKEYLLATGSADRTMKLWGLESFKLVGSTEMGTSPVQAVKFYVEDQTILSASQDSLRIYASDGLSSPLDTIDVDWKGIQDMRLCFPEEKLLAISCEDSQLGIWVADLQKKPGDSVRAGSGYAPAAARVPQARAAAAPAKAQQPQAAPRRAERASAAASAYDPDGLEPGAQEAPAPRGRSGEPERTEAPACVASSPKMRGSAPATLPAQSGEPAGRWGGSSPNGSFAAPQLPQVGAQSPVGLAARAQSPTGFGGPSPSASGPAQQAPSSVPAVAVLGSPPVGGLGSPAHGAEVRGRLGAQPSPASVSADAAGDQVLRDLLDSASGRTGGAACERRCSPEVPIRATSPVADVVGRPPSRTPGASREPGDPAMLSRMTNATKIAQFTSQHPQMLGVLQKRISQARNLKEFWAKGDLVALQQALQQPQDQAVVCDFLRVIMQNRLFGALNLDACQILLPVLRDLTGSKYEDFVVIAFQFTEILLQNFGDVITGTRQSCRGIPERELDIAREDRLRKCNACHDQFKEIQRLLSDSRLASRFSSLRGSLQTFLHPSGQN
eukprot:gnl/TRDRNA2_/TRDRNA2_67575_c0_seq1.p1 gnl/TRDRNA2_/TRDRNA2_67575_c0~~gnl/TRDRNA2_/TRDRNA2_67575_c0_seq1.p1  ORF type:complete len:777 (+),score=108.62 gnl/TRDRNA2_/TRDRNA2_67575_c0_seq1:336-2333(+)